MTTHPSVTPESTANSLPMGLVNRWLPSLFAALLGLVILYGVGFAPLAAHNAAHDARHSVAFPCH
ncbi:MAG: CbtB-domain containing protein [Gammaproteobacteria bacterium]|nr:CbtB-domain containing protein [Gammaproteobacteria bacterium]